MVSIRFVKGLPAHLENMADVYRSAAASTPSNAAEQWSCVHFRIENLGNLLKREW